MNIVSDTPNSERSVYFDAPMANFQNNNSAPSSQDMPQPFTNGNTYQLHDDGPVSTYDTHDDQKPRRVLQRNESSGWLPAVDDAPEHTTSPHSKREGSIASVRDRDFATHSRNPTAYSDKAGSISSKRGSTLLTRTGSRKSTHTASDGRQIQGSAFVGGAGATGPMSTAEQDEDLRVRGAEATASLTPKQKTKIAKDEVKQGKRLSKIIKQEGKTEKQALAIAIQELADLQKHQKLAVKSEARVQHSHNKILTSFKKTEETCLRAKSQYETALAHLNSEAEALEALRNSAREATERMQDKAAEVDSLRATLAVDAREREVKLAQLKGTVSKKGSLWR